MNITGIVVSCAALVPAVLAIAYQKKDNVAGYGATMGGQQVTGFLWIVSAILAGVGTGLCCAWYCGIGAFILVFAIGFRTRAVLEARLKQTDAPEDTAPQADAAETPEEAPGYTGKTAAREKKIEAAALMADLDAILEEIAEEGTVYIVAIEGETFVGDSEFIFGPESVCGAVFGLQDAEYGWPEGVEVEKVEDISDLAPAYRRHPGILKNGKVKAMGIQLSEYEEIKRRQAEDE